MTKNKNILGRGVSYLIAAVGALVILLPFYVTVITAFKTPEQSAVYPPHLIPNPFSLRSFEEALSGGMFLTYLKNTVFITVMSTIGTLISSSLAAFGFGCLYCRIKGFWRKQAS